MQKKKDSKNRIQLRFNKQKRETEILNIICNTTILLMSIMTEAFTGMFTEMSKEMMKALTREFDAATATTKELHGEANTIQSELSTQIRKQLLATKKDVTAQIGEKKEKLASLLEDKKFNKGIAIVARYNFNLPKLNSDLDERALLGYIILLQENDESFSKMFQALLAWMKDLPQP